MAVLTLPGVKRFWKNVKEYIDSRILASQNTFPTKVSDLQNDAGYYNQSTLPAINNGILTIQKNGKNVSTFSANQNSNATANIQVPTKVSELTNDSGYLTEHQDLSDFATKQDISNLIDSAPTTLDTLKELADAIGNDPDFASTIATQIASKADDDAVVHKHGTETIPGEKEFVQPIKGSVTGNAGTADEFKSEKFIVLSGDVTGSAFSKGDWALTTALAPSGVSEGVYGQSTDVLDTKSLDIKIPEITVDSKGRITNIVDRNVTATIPTGAFDDNNFVDLTSNQIVDGIKTFNETINGDLNGNANTCTEYFLNMVDTAEDLENALNTKPPTLKDVFETWYRFSHTGNTQYNLSNATGQALTDLQGWQFDENKMRIANNVNTDTYTGFISNRKYKKYTLGIKVCGPDEEFEQLFGTAGYLKDDDMFGIVCGYMKDDQGNEHTLSFIRDAAATICGLYYDYGKSTSVMLYNALSQVTVIHKGDGESSGTDDGWYMKYAHMEVQRDGSTLNIRGSQINEDNFSITFTYNASDVPDSLNIDAYNNIRSMLLNKSNVGVSLLSQNGFMYLERFDGLFNSNDIYDTLNNVIYAYDSNNNSWYLTNRKVSDEVADYSRIYNENTEKSFVYYDEKSYMTSCNMYAGSNLSLSGTTLNVSSTPSFTNITLNGYTITVD